MTLFNRMIVRRDARAALRFIALGGLAVTLAGCYQQTVAENDYPWDVRERHPITLQQGRQTVEVFLGRYRGGLTPTQRADVLAFAQGWRHDATSGIVLDVPSNRDTGRAATASLHEIYSIFAASGVPHNAVRLRRYRAVSTTLASIKLNYAKLVANAGPCGEWPNDIGPGGGRVYASNRPYWNFGCAQQHNIAAMVANPADLVQPRATTPAYEARRSAAIEKYTKGDNPTSSGDYQNDDKAKISDLGK
ncbi:MAG TPA: CpaD family pilus assembly protein [Pseudolabrys sp.]|nr:CpaD family pilus assembly protein [Pseudolabrys sp.]